MCLSTTPVAPYQRWNWAGDEIVHDSTIPAARKVPGTSTKRYPIDVREFLSIGGNSVLGSEIRSLRAGLVDAGDRAAFERDQPGSFDRRADVVTAHVRTRLSYRKRKGGFDEWLFPDETLASGGGDCEDLAFALVALLAASGISPYCLRVALGKVVVKRHKQPARAHDHAWVVYQNERGTWEILEPFTIAAGADPKRVREVVRAHKAEPVSVEYVPHFVFNAHHLWRVRGSDDATQSFEDYAKKRAEYWVEFDPSFAAGVHASIYDDALLGMPAAQLARIKRVSLDVDVNVLAYDPRDHFDFAYVDEAWQRVGARLATGALDDFGLAVHAIGDFYAHTMYGEFAPKTASGDLVCYQHGGLAAPPAYDFGRLGEMPGAGGVTTAQAEAHWNGKLVSGQWWRWFTTFPSDLKAAADFGWRRCLPDHDAVSVDSATRKDAHRLYDEEEYQVQFALRRDAAVRHIQLAYEAWPGRPKS